MASEWRERPLEEICEFLNRGAAPSYIDRKGMMVLNQKCVRDGSVLFDQARRTDPTAKRVSKDRILKHFDVLVNSTGVGTLGRVAQMLLLPEAATVDSHVTIVRADPQKVFPRYLGFALRYYQPKIESLAEGSTGQTELSRTRLAQLLIALPPSLEQQAIAAILGSLDDKIDLNRRMNETLEAMARAIFKDWFVDFGPTRAKMEGRAPYLAQEIWDLFPDALDDEGKPAGWDRKQLRDVLELNPPEKLKKGEPAPYLEMAALPTRGASSSAPIDRAFTSGTKFRNGDTLLARITPCLENGKTAFVQCLDGDSTAWGSTEFIVMRSIHPVPKPYSYLLARDQDFRRHAIQSMTGTSGRQRVTTDAIAAYPLTTPCIESVWLALGALIDPMFQKIAANADESRTLAQTRDLLLPKLMSGEIRIKDVEKTVESIL